MPPQDLAGSNIHRQNSPRLLRIRMFVIRSSYRARAPSAQNPLRTRAKNGFFTVSVSGRTAHSSGIEGHCAPAFESRRTRTHIHFDPDSRILPGIYTTLPVSELSWTMVWYPRSVA